MRHQRTHLANVKRATCYRHEALISPAKRLLFHPTDSRNHAPFPIRLFPFTVTCPPPSLRPDHALRFSPVSLLVEYIPNPPESTLHSWSFQFSTSPLIRLNNYLLTQFHLVVFKPHVQAHRKVSLGINQGQPLFTSSYLGLSPSHLAFLFSASQPWSLQPGSDTVGNIRPFIARLYTLPVMSWESASVNTVKNLAPDYQVQGFR